MTAAPHILRIKHDQACHEDDCHDECSAELICPGATEACQVWWECPKCQETARGLDGDAYDDWMDRMWDEDDEAWHGLDHSRIDGDWMVKSDPPQCMTYALEHNAYDLVDALPEGDHEVDLDCDEGFVYVIPIKEPVLLDGRGAE